jgi:hypothetical protein
VNEAERQDLKDRILAHFEDLLAAPKARESAWWSFLNSTFCVTVIGGLLLAGISAFWQWRQAGAALERARIEREYDRKQTLLVEFAREFPYALILARDYKQRELWIAKHLGNAGDPNFRFRDGRTFAEGRDFYEKHREKFYRGRTAQGFAARIQTTFHGTPACALAGALVHDMDALQNADEEAVVTDHVHKLEKTYESLIVAMGSAVDGNGGSP